MVDNSHTEDELYYYETACQLQWAMHNFIKAYAKIGGSRKDLCETPAIRSCLAMILDSPTGLTHKSYEICSCGSHMLYHSDIQLDGEHRRAYRCPNCKTERYILIADG